MHQFLYPGEAETYRLPKSPPPAIAPGSFMVCPLALIQTWSAAQLHFQSTVYQIAFDQAQAIAQPSLLERDLLGVWN
jgi:hypothetical protein